MNKRDGIAIQVPGVFSPRATEGDPLEILGGRCTDAYFFPAISLSISNTAGDKR